MRAFWIGLFDTLAHQMIQVCFIVGPTSHFLLLSVSTQIDVQWNDAAICLMDKMAVNLNTFGPFVGYGIGSNEDSIRIVNMEQCSMWLRTLRYSLSLWYHVIRDWCEKLLLSPYGMTSLSTIYNMENYYLLQLKSRQGSITSLLRYLRNFTVDPFLLYNSFLGWVV